MKSGGLISVAEARERILAGVTKERPCETIALAKANGRTLARDLAANLSQPPKTMSAMDGYALRAGDLVQLPVQLKLIGESAAGHGFTRSVGRLETVRIFTGAPLPPGCDTVLVQEKARLVDGFVKPLEAVPQGRNIRGKGIDFAQGDVLLSAGTRLGPTNIALAAAMNHAKVDVTRRPRIALLATGDELVRPGETLGEDQIISSNPFSIAALVETAGGEIMDLGIARDELGALERGIGAAREQGADLLVTLGGASAGDHDLVKPALARQGMELDFWKIAMRPGKPVIHGRLKDMMFLGLPGNPVAAFVSGLVFLVPLVRALCGDPNAGSDQSEAAILGKPQRPNDARQDYLRARLRPGGTGLPVAEPFDLQDSSLLRILAQSQCLVIRPPHAPAAAAGDVCRILRFGFSG